MVLPVLQKSFDIHIKNRANVQRLNEERLSALELLPLTTVNKGDELCYIVVISFFFSPLLLFLISDVFFAPSALSTLPALAIHHPLSPAPPLATVATRLKEGLSFPAGTCPSSLHVDSLSLSSLSVRPLQGLRRPDGEPHPEHGAARQRRLGRDPRPVPLLHEDPRDQAVASAASLHAASLHAARATPADPDMRSGGVGGEGF